jgi:hypothetical protein
MGKGSGKRVNVSYSGGPAKVYWGPTAYSASLNGSDGTGALAYSSSQSDLNQGLAYYTGSTVIYESSGSSWLQRSLSCRLKMKATLTQSGSAAALVLGETVGATAALVLPMSKNVGYTVDLRFEIYNGSSWEAALDYFNRIQTKSWVQTLYSFDYGFFYDRAPTSVSLSGNHVVENCSGAVFVGQFQTDDLDSGTPTYQIITNDSPYFIFSGNELWAGRGFAAAYSNSSRVLAERSDQLINFDWGGGSPALGVPSDYFSGRWTGRVVPRATGTHYFSVSSDDSSRLYINGNKVIDQAIGTATSAGLSFTKGVPVDVVLEMSENWGGALARLSWQQPGESVYKPVPGGVTTSPFYDFESKNTYTVRVRVTDTAGQTFENNLGVAIDNVNEAPFVSLQIPDQSRDEDFSTVLDLANLGQYFKDPEGKSVKFSATMSPANKATLSFPSTDALRLSSVRDASGSVTVSVVGTDPDDSALKVTNSFVFKINPVNDAPVAGTMPSYTGSEDTFNQTLDLQTVFSDVDGDTLSYRVVGVYVPNTTNAFDLVTGSITGSTLRLTGVGNRNGDAEVLIEATDPSKAAAKGRIRVALAAVNDPPSFTAGPNISVNEDCGTTNLVSWMTGVSPGGWNEDVQNMTATVVAANTALFSVQPQISINKSAGTGGLTFTPAANQNGTTTVSVYITDDANAGGAALRSLTNTFQITIAPVNDAPRIDYIADQSMDEVPNPTTGASLPLTVNPTGIDGGPNESTDTVTLAVAISNSSPPGLIISNQLSAVSGGSATLKLYSAPYKNGTATISVTARDQLGAESSRQFQLRVRDVDHAPILGDSFTNTIAINEDSGTNTMVLHGAPSYSYRYPR